MKIPYVYTISDEELYNLSLIKIKDQILLKDVGFKKNTELNKDKQIKEDTELKKNEELKENKELKKDTELKENKELKKDTELKENKELKKDTELKENKKLKKYKKIKEDTELKEDKKIKEDIELKENKELKEDKKYICVECNKSFPKLQNINESNNNTNSHNIYNINIELKPVYEDLNIDKFIKFAVLLSNNNYLDIFKILLNNNSYSDKKNISMEKIYSKLKEFNEEIKEALLEKDINIDKNIFDNLLSAIELKFMDYKSNENVSKTINEIIPNIYNNEFNNIATPVTACPDMKVLESGVMKEQMIPTNIFNNLVKNNDVKEQGY
jgi:hypothetical protein